MTSPFAPLADRHAALRTTLEEAIARASRGELPPTERDALKEQIIALYKQVDAVVAESQALKEQVKALATEWKRIAPPSADTAPVTFNGPLRVDHLGASTFIEKGWSKLSLGDAAGAGEALQKAMQLAPGSNEAETLLGWSYMQQNQLAQATAHLKAVLARESTHALASATLGAVEMKRGEAAAAFDLLDEVIHADRDRKATLYAYLYLGQLHREHGRLDDAEQAFRKALELGPNLLQAWYELGWTYWNAARRDDALTAWRTGAEANKFSPWGKRCAEVIIEVEQGGTPSLR